MNVPSTSDIKTSIGKEHIMPSEPTLYQRTQELAGYLEQISETQSSMRGILFGEGEEASKSAPMPSSLEGNNPLAAMIDADRAEELGYARYRCPHCGRSFWTDGDPRGECCPEPDEEEDEGEDDGSTGQVDAGCSETSRLTDADCASARAERDGIRAQSLSREGQDR